MKEIYFINHFTPQHVSLHLAIQQITQTDLADCSRTVDAEFAETTKRLPRGTCDTVTNEHVKYDVRRQGV